jgi:predicted transcriptional regulator
MVLFQSFFWLFNNFKYMPKANIDGTQRPIKIAEFTSPLKYNISEKISEIIAAINKSLSVIVNFLNMIL